jgi:aryl-alcohol dehydrogenase-like predicted oxidoreductase
MAIEGFDWLKDRWLTEDKLNTVKQLATFANELNVSLPALSIAWCLNNCNVTTVILGATKKEQLEENLKALDIVPMLTKEVVEKIETIVQTKPVQPQF